MLKEFREFAFKGNVIDLAVGVIIGGAFGKIVTSLVSDVLMPAIGIILGGVSFKDLKYVITPAIGEVPAVTLNYGSFIQSIVDFFIIAISIFLFVKLISLTRKKEAEAAPPAPPAPAAEVVLLEEIRDLLKAK